MQSKFTNLHYRQDDQQAWISIHEDFL